jgi:hypothetical protein
MSEPLELGADIGRKKFYWVQIGKIYSLVSKSGLPSLHENATQPTKKNLGQQLVKMMWNSTRITTLDIKVSN